MKQQSQQLLPPAGPLARGLSNLLPVLRRHAFHLVAAGILATFSATVMAVEEPPVGLNQSPINIMCDALEHVDEDDLPRLRTRYSSKASLSITNTGSPGEEATIRVDVAPGAARLRYDGNWYDLLQFHWHTPSEHQLEGAVASMEMHLVHRKQGSTGLNDLLVIGVLIVEGKKHKELDKIFRRLPAQTGITVPVSKFDLNELLPDDDDLASFRYAGSLTTPPFSEGVQWIVLAEPIEMSARQIEAFVHLFEEGNTRPPQPLNGRVVVTDVERDHGDCVGHGHGAVRQPAGDRN